MAFFNSLSIDVIDGKLNIFLLTLIFGLCRDSTAEVGIPTKPAPKQLTLYDFFYIMAILY